MDDQHTPQDDPQYVPARRAPEPGRAVAPPPQRFVLEQSGGKFGKYGKFLWIALAVCVLIILGQSAAYQSYFTEDPKIEEKFVSGATSGADKVAVIEVKGTIMSGEGFVKRQIDQVKKDKHVKAIVLRIDSPGGTVTGSDYIYHHLKKLVENKDRKLPLVVSMGGLCASGGYYVAMAVGDEPNSIYAEPTTWTGSIGVIIPHYDFSGLLEKWNIEDDSVASHKYKQLLSMTRQRSEADQKEIRAILQELVNESFEGFKDIVRSGRPKLAKDDEKLKSLATGQIFTADQALESGLVDRIGFLDDAVDRAIELAGLDKEKVRVVKYDQPMPAILSMLCGAKSQSATAALDGGLAQLFDMTAPRAYYLCTWAPALLTNTRGE